MRPADTSHSPDESYTEALPLERRRVTAHTINGQWCRENTLEEARV
jgi:hypothetical protein